MDNHSYFEEKYKKEESYFGLKPNKIIIRILDFIKKGDVLDLGVGEGRNALFLAKNGFSVVGVDISETAIKNFLQSAKKLNVKVKGIIQEIEKYQFDKNYDLIISNSTLHFMKKEDVIKTIDNMKKHTNTNGINLITVFTVDNPSKEFSHLFEKNELKNYYNGWNIIHYEEYTTPIEKHGENGKLHKHVIAEIIARKI